MAKSAKGKVTSMKALKAMKALASKTPMKIKKAAMKTHKKKEATPPTLTTTNVKKIGGDECLDLATKMDLFRKGELSHNNFSAEEKRCLWNRFHAAKQLNSEAASKWDALPSAGRGNQNLKNAFLWAWVKDPAWGKHFMERVNTLTVSQKHNKKLSWLTYKQLCDKHGKDEADDLIKSKSINMRPNPKNNKFFQFLDEDEEMNISTDRKKAFNASQKGDIKPNAFKRLCAGLGTISHDDMEALHANPDFNDASEEDEDDENADVALPVSLKKLMGVNKTRNKNQGLPGTGKHANDAGKDAKDAGKDAKSAGKEHQAVDKKTNAQALDEINRTCTVLGSDDKSAIMEKANRMHSIVAKVMKTCDADTKKKLQTMMVKLQGKIFNKTSSGVKDLILEAATVLKACTKK
jgi:hypothetical protein